MRRPTFIGIASGLSLLVSVGVSACEPEFHDIYCLDPESGTLPVCVERLGRGGASAAGPAGQAGAAGQASGGSAPGGGGTAGGGGSIGGAGGGGAGTDAVGGAAGSTAMAGGAGASGSGTGTAGVGGSVGVGGLGGAAGASAGGAGAGGGSAGAAGGGGCLLGEAACKAPVEIALGRAHACLRLLDGRAYCWGEGAKGQLGGGTTQGAPAAPGVLVPDLSAQRVSAGGDSSCATSKTGAVLCWGDDALGQLGRGAEAVGEARAKPTVVAGLAVARSVTVGVSTACAIEVSGGVRCWGDNRAGQLGSGSTVSRTPVSSVFSGDPSPSETSVAVGAVRFCGRRSPSTAQCVGGDRFGDGLTDADAGFDLIGGVGTVSSVAVGAYFGCATEQSGGAVFCWGRGDEGQLGVGGASSANRRLDGEAVPGLTGITTLAAGTAHACAVLPTKKVTCWGDCSQGACGNGQPIGSTPTVPIPAVVPNLDNVKTVFAGHQATCALRDDNTLLCWGAVAGAAPTSVPTVVTLP